MEERRTYTDAERAALIEQYQSWGGSQRAFADSVGVAQGTMSKWLAGYPSRQRVPTGERNCQGPGCGATLEGRRAGTRFCSGSCRARWSKTHESPTQARVVQRSGPPAFLEVVPVETPTVEVVPDEVPSSARLVLGDRVTLVFDRLPPAAWVAQLAAELGRC